MNLGDLKMFECKKYGVSMLASAADETCAKRFEEALNENSTIYSFEKCRSCKRGAVMYGLGKHKAVSRKAAKGETIAVKIATQGKIDDNFIVFNETIPGKIETNLQKGESTVATHAKSSCTTERCDRPTQKDGLCYKCFKAKHGYAPYSSQAKKAGTAKARGARGKDKAVLSHAVTPSTTLTRSLSLKGEGQADKDISIVGGGGRS